ncbi:MAG: flagellar biosynthetic protein FliO, partial [Pseudomonadota bacterium]
MPVRFTVAFVVVLVLIVITAWVIKRISGGGLGGNWSRGRDHRLEVIDAAAVDPKRRLVLVRRDDKEHLILIGGATDIVVETGIDAPATPETAAEQGAEENLTDTPQGSPPDTIGAPNYEPPRIEPGIAAAAAPVAAVTAAAPVIASSGAPDDETHIATSPAGEASPEVELMHTPEVEELTTEITFDETALVAALEADVAQDLSAIEIEPIDDVRPSEPEKGVAAAQEETNEVLDATASQPAPVDMTPVIPLRPKRVIPEAETSIDADKSSDANVAQFEFDAPNMPDVADAVGSTPEPEADEALEGALSQAIAEPGEKTEAVEPTETEAQQLEPGTDLSAETASLEETLEDATDTSAEGDAVAA